jgi:hypothetical protein
MKRFLIKEDDKKDVETVLDLSMIPYDYDEGDFMMIEDKDCDEFYELLELNDIDFDEI